jgi:hypothetical protein
MISRSYVVFADKLGIEADIPESSGSKWMDGKHLDMNGLLVSFQDYWSKHSEMYIKNNMFESLVNDSINIALDKYVDPNKPYLYIEMSNIIKDGMISLTNEALTHLVIFAFLQRVLNGGADFIQREYALGTMRPDICIGYKGLYYPLEIKIKSSIEGPKKL